MIIKVKITFILVYDLVFRFDFVLLKFSSISKVSHKVSIFSSYSVIICSKSPFYIYIYINIWNKDI